MKKIWDVILLLSSFLLVFVWQKTALALYTLQALGALMVLLIILSIKRKHIFPQDHSINPFAAFGEDSPLTIFLFNTIVLLFVFATGGFTSPFFFLLFFLVFGVAFFLEPSIVFVFTIGTIAIFFPDALKDDVWGNMFKLGSIALIAPLSYFFGKGSKDQMKKEQQIEKVKEKTTTAAKTVTEDISAVLNDPKTSLTDEDKNKLTNARNQSEKITDTVNHL
ncbi:MAG: hypothetical protein HY429_02450 [Candidatus Levybacteria bacterium]|nr:hypothetical protein [Candidatus Levybacteria bacterium]